MIAASSSVRTCAPSSRAAPGTLNNIVKAERSQAGAAAELMRLLHLELLTRGLKTSGLLAVSTVTTDTEIDRLTDTLFDVLDSFRQTIEAVAPTLLQPVSQPV